MNKFLKFFKDMIPFDLIQQFGGIIIIVIIFAAMSALFKWLQLF